MIFYLIALMLFLGVAFFQTIQGTFSALIMLVMTVLSAAVAVNYYPAISQGYLLDRIPDYGDALALMVLFAAILITLRTVADNFVRANIVIWGWPDRILAAVLSIPTSLMLVGVGCIAFQMLPFDDQLLWFNHFSDNGKAGVRVDSLYPTKADDFADWMLAKLSGGSLKNTTNFRMLHPDWPSEASAQRIAVQRESKHAVLPDAIGLAAQGVWNWDGSLIVRDFAKSNSGQPGSQAADADTPRPAADGKKYLVARMEFRPSAQDSDGYVRFGWGQIRMVGFLGADRDHPVNVYAIGARDPKLSAKYLYLRSKLVTSLGTDSYDQEVRGERNFGIITKESTIDVVFEVPSLFTPWFIEYKRWARTPVTKVAEKDPTAFEVHTEPGPPKGTVGQVATPGIHNQFKADPNRTAFTNEFPFKLQSGAAKGAGGPDTEISGTKFVRGRISGTVGGSAGLDAGPGQPVSEFEVASDKRLLRVECYFESAENQLVQNVFGMVSGIAQQKAYDNKGNAHLPIGKYVILNLSDGTQQVELVFHGTDTEGEMAAGRDQFQTVNRQQLQINGGKVGFFYAVPAGTVMERFEPGRPFESQTLQLTAPN